MSTFAFAAISLLLCAALVSVWSRWRKLARAERIRSYVFPRGLLDRLGIKRPELSLKERQLVAHALRQFFLAYLKSGCKFISMPSQAADELWREFMLSTRHYETFCNEAFGQFLQHTPAVALGTDRHSNSGLRRTWRYCCLAENINPESATRLPLLFSLDKKLNIDNGFLYTLNCKGLKHEGGQSSGGSCYCAGDMSSSSFDGTTDGLGDSSSSCGNSSADSGGDGGDGGGGD